MKKSTVFLTVALSGFLFAACGGGESESEETPAAPVEETTPAAEEENTIPDVAEVTIEGNDLMQFNLDKIEVYEGQTVRLTFKNVGELPKEAMGHNWTLLARGVDPVEYGNAVIRMKDTEYQDPNRADDVIVHTAILGPGESETLEFDAPAKGVYKFVCTFPGHAGVMNGSFMVRGR